MSEPKCVCDACGGRGVVAIPRERLLAFTCAPGSSCPEHEMCAECAGTGSASENGCVCGYASPICNKPFMQAPDVRTEWCWNQISGFPCGHDRACHSQPLPAANTQETSND